MKTFLLIPLAVFAVAAAAQSQSTIWRCGTSYYTSDAAEAKARGCKVMEGGNVTVIEGTRVIGNTGGAAQPSAGASPGGTVRVANTPRIDSAEQRARDAEARSILEAELKKAEARHAELVKEYNNGEPEKMGPEHRNHQKYLDRVADLKASIARNESDIAGLKRELSRAGGTVPASK